MKYGPQGDKTFSCLLLLTVSSNFDCLAHLGRLIEIYLFNTISVVFHARESSCDVFWYSVVFSFFIS